jgi:hypothetical protein
MENEQQPASPTNSPADGMRSEHHQLRKRTGATSAFPLEEMLTWQAATGDSGPYVALGARGATE